MYGLTTSITNRLYSYQVMYYEDMYRKVRIQCLLCQSGTAAAEFYHTVVTASVMHQIHVKHTPGSVTIACAAHS